MNKGDRVRVYFDPLTEREFEDEVRLVERVGEVGFWEGRVVARWKVKFIGESKIYERNILEPKEGTV